MANTFEEQARDRFMKSLKFMEKAESLVEDDLVYRSALADAVSSIKNMLQGYLLLRVAATPASAVTQRWQEVAASNRMPELIAACGEAGLDLRGLAVDIRRLNTDRNNRAHDDPQRHIGADEATHAIETARTLQRRIRATVQGRQEVRSLPNSLPKVAAQAASVVRAAASGQLRASVAAAPEKRPVMSSVESMLPAPSVPASSGPGTNGSAPAAHTESPSANGNRTPATVAVRPPSDAEPPTHDAASAIDALDDSGESDGDSSAEMPAVSPRRPKRLPGSSRRRAARVLPRLLVAATLLLVGIAAGMGVTIPVTTGHAPGWLSFATRLLPTAPASTPPTTAVASPTPHATTSPQTIGLLTVSAPTCAAGSAMLTLTNSGNKAILWSLGSLDASGAVFAVSPGATGAPTLAGTLAGGGGATVYAADPGATGPYSIVVVATGGTVQLVAPAC